jgi:peroxiredoxin
VSIDIGAKAPTFSLPSTTGEVSLEELIRRGSTVVAFYPKDNTSG